MKLKELLEQDDFDKLLEHKDNKEEMINSLMSSKEFNEKWALPAYLRRGMKVDGNLPHSSEPFISRYNLNDDNNLLGNNKFLHDNVD